MRTFKEACLELDRWIITVLAWWKWKQIFALETKAKNAYPKIGKKCILIAGAYSEKKVTCCKKKKGGNFISPINHTLLTPNLQVSLPPPPSSFSLTIIYNSYPSTSFIPFSREYCSHPAPTPALFSLPLRFSTITSLLPRLSCLQGSYLPSVASTSFFCLIPRFCIFAPRFYQTLVEGSLISWIRMLAWTPGRWVHVQLCHFLADDLDKLLNWLPPLTNEM